MTRSLFEIAPSMRIGIGLPTSAHPKSHPCGRRPLMLAGAAALLALAACGGGGGGDNAGEPQYAVRTAMGYWLNAPASWTLQGSVAGGQKYTVKITSAPLPPGPVPIVGGTAARSLQMYSAEVDGVTIDGGPTFYFDSTSLSFIGSDNGTGTCSVVTANTALPSAATVGSSGAVYTDSDYDSCASGATVVATTKSTWSLEANAGIVMLCWKMTALDLGGGELATQSTCIEVAQDGTLGGKARLAVTASGITLIDARNF